jgi:outer membrane protein insertion porin family/translocation and assembly module TamA
VAIPVGEGTNELGVHPTRRFYAGGPNSVRGYAQFRLGPKALTINAVDLTKTDEGRPGCTPQQINSGQCDVSTLARERPNEFDVQPLGGEASFEGSVELRFPIIGENIRGAAFVDYGQVWQEFSDMQIRDLAFTPGLGVRYFSPIGPIRVDIGYNPRGAETVRLFTTQVGVRETSDGDCMTYPEDPGPDPILCATPVLQAQPDVIWHPRKGFFRKIQFHFSIGQAF